MNIKNKQHHSTDSEYAQIRDCRTSFSFIISTLSDDVPSRLFSTRQRVCEKVAKDGIHA